MVCRAMAYMAYMVMAHIALAYVVIVVMAYIATIQYTAYVIMA